MKKRLGSFLLSGLALLAISSFFVHPFGAIKAQRSDKPLLLDSTFDPQVVRTLEKSCRNCHSEKTEWPWYSYVIVSVQSREPKDMNSWRLADDRASYSAETIETVSPGGDV